jgi:hypothetical protein
MLRVVRSGADEMLPVCTWVLIRAGPRHLVSQTEAMQDWLDRHGSFSLGQMGWCLATMQVPGVQTPQYRCHISAFMW